MVPLSLANQLLGYSFTKAMTASFHVLYNSLLINYSFTSVQSEELTVSLKTLK